MNCTRRDFLQTGLGSAVLASLPGAFGGVLARTAAAAAQPSAERDTVLVVLQLTGGNDGLNTVIPYAHDEYARRRPTLRFAAGEVHKIDDELGFHPRMEALWRVYQQGHLQIIQGVGSPGADRSHEGAMRIWHTASPERPQMQTGWLGRAADACWNPQAYDAPVVFVGPIAPPFALNAETAVIPAVTAAGDLTLQSRWDSPGHRRATSASGEAAEPVGSPLLRYVRQCASRAGANSKRIQRVLASSGGGDYPSFTLAGHLQTVARLIRADIGIRIVLVELGGGGIGGFDNHANQKGNHCALLGQLSESIGAFVGDLQRDKTLDRVLLMTFSEFGRTLPENGRRGTGHGAGAVTLLVGGRVKGGLTGSHPSLTDLEDGALRVQYDFRRVYAAILDGWLGLDSRAILGASFEPLDIVRA